MKELVTLFREGDVEGARRIDGELEPAYKILEVVINPIPIKAALNLLGHDVGGLRLPLVAATDDETEAVRGLLERAGLLAPVANSTAQVPVDTLRIVPLGGLGEVGKNMTVFEADGDFVVVDAGLAFPRDEHLGVDLILPDFSYLRERAGRIRAVVLTHGHEDHVGALPYLLREVPIPQVWATRLTLGLVKSKLDEHGLLQSTELREANPRADRSRSDRSGSSSSAWRTRFPTRSPSCSRSDGLRVLHTATTSSTTRPSTG